jgi:hypothetical protein
MMSSILETIYTWMPIWIDREAFGWFVMGIWFVILFYLTRGN